jgi:hypothetical protein
MENGARFAGEDHGNDESPAFGGHENGAGLDHMDGAGGAVNGENHILSFPNAIHTGQKGAHWGLMTGAGNIVVTEIPQNVREQAAVPARGCEHAHIRSVQAGNHKKVAAMPEREQDTPVRTSEFLDRFDSDPFYPQRGRDETDGSGDHPRIDARVEPVPDFLLEGQVSSRSMSRPVTDSKVVKFVRNVNRAVRNPVNIEKRPFPCRSMRASESSDGFDSLPLSESIIQFSDHTPLHMAESWLNPAFGHEVEGRPSNGYVFVFS